MGKSLTVSCLGEFCAPVVLCKKGSRILSYVSAVTHSLGRGKSHGSTHPRRPELSQFVNGLFQPPNLALEIHKETSRMGEAKETRAG